MSHTFTYLVTAEIERTQGKFVSLSDISDPLVEAIESGAQEASLTGLGDSGNSDYEVVAVEVEEIDKKALKKIREDYEAVIVSELPGDDETRATLRETIKELKQAKDEIVRLTEKLEIKKAETAAGVTDLFVSNGYDEESIYLPVGPHTEATFTRGKDQYRVSFVENGIEIMSLGYGYHQMAIIPQSGNRVTIKGI